MRMDARMVMNTGNQFGGPRGDYLQIFVLLRVLEKFIASLRLCMNSIGSSTITSTNLAVGFDIGKLTS